MPSSRYERVISNVVNRPEFTALSRPIAVSLWVGLIAGWLIVSQRLHSGAMVAIIPWVVWWYVSLVVVSLVQVAVFLEAMNDRTVIRPIQPGEFFLPLAWSLSLAGTDSPGRLIGAVMWGIASVLVAQQVARGVWEAIHHHELQQDTHPVAKQVPESSFPTTTNPHDAISEETQNSVDANRVQWSQRTREGEQETIEGEVAATFEPGQRETTIHVSFCPPLSAKPELDVEDVGGGTTELRVTGLFSYGARIVARRTSDFDESLTTEIAYRASAPAA